MKGQERPGWWDDPLGLPLPAASLALLERLGACAERLRAMDMDAALLAPTERREP